jgi:hypothetical protein
MAALGGGGGEGEAGRTCGEGRGAVVSTCMLGGGGGEGEAGRTCGEEVRAPW